MGHGDTGNMKFTHGRRRLTLTLKYDDITPRLVHSFFSLHASTSSAIYAVQTHAKLKLFVQ